MFTEKFSWMSTIHAGIFRGWTLWADSISLRMNTIVSCDPSCRRGAWGALNAAKKINEHCITARKVYETP